jgi:hypothetical protein
VRPQPPALVPLALSLLLVCCTCVLFRHGRAHAHTAPLAHTRVSHGGGGFDAILIPARPKRRPHPLHIAQRHTPSPPRLRCCAQAPDLILQDVGPEWTSAPRTSSRSSTTAIVRAVVRPAYVSAPSLPSVFLPACWCTYTSGATPALVHTHARLLGACVRAAAGPGRFRTSPQARDARSLPRVADRQRMGGVAALHCRRRFLQEICLAGRGGLCGCSSSLASATRQRAASRGAPAGTVPPAALGSCSVLPILRRAQARTSVSTRPVSAGEGSSKGISGYGDVS